jgi:integrase/recombinase XerC
MLEKFLEYLQYEKRYSHHTIRNYASDLVQLKKYLKDEFEQEDVSVSSHIQLRSWTVSMSESEANPSTIKRKISAVKAYFKWLKKFHGLQLDPTVKLILPKSPKRLPVYVEEEQMEQLSTLGLFPDTFEGLRDRAIIEMFYHTGIRCAELIGLKVFDVDIQRSTIKVLGKRNKERLIPVGEGLLSVLSEYLAKRSDLNVLKDMEVFFLTKRGLKLYPRLVYDVVNTYLGNVSSLRKKSPHVLRHTFATHMLNRGADLNAIKEILGHASLAATQVYTHNSVEKLKNIHRESHPNG